MRGGRKYATGMHAEAGQWAHMNIEAINVLIVRCEGKDRDLTFLTLVPGGLTNTHAEDMTSVECAPDAMTGGFPYTSTICTDL